MEIGFMEIDGHYLDGETSKRVPARLTITSVDERSLTLNVKSPDAAAQVFNLDYDQLTIQSRLGNTPREITFYLDAGTDVGGKNFGAKHSGIEAEAGAALRKNITTRQLFVTDNNDAIDELIGAIDGPGSSGLLHKLESHLGLIVFATLATIAIIWGTIVYGIPTAAKIIAYQMAGFVTEQFGGSLDLLDKTLFEPSNLQEDQLAHVRELVEPYLRSHEDLHPKLNFRAGMEANAFALPGGDIVLTDEFVKLAENDEELLAVVFHELGHLKYRHITRRALQGSMITLLVVFVTGDVSSVDLLTALPTLILDLSYSREFESEADLYALDQMHDAGIDLVHFSNMRERLEAFYLEPDSHSDSGSNESCNKPVAENSDSKDIRHYSESIPEFLSTHPATENRVLLVERYKREHGLL